MDSSIVEKIDPESVELRISSTFSAQLREKRKKFPDLGKKIWAFWQEKKDNPFKRLGGDLPTVGIFTELVPGIQHYKLGKDLRLWWRVSGHAPTYVDLIGIYSHEETGTGAPKKSNIMRQSAEKMRADLSQLVQVPKDYEFK